MRESASRRRVGQKSAKQNYFTGINYLAVKHTLIQSPKGERIELGDEPVTAVHNRFLPQKPVLPAAGGFPAADAPASEGGDSYHVAAMTPNR